MNDYERSIQAIREYDCKISVKEWNKMAIKYNYLSSNSLRRLYNMNFRDLCIKIRKN